MWWNVAGLFFGMAVVPIPLLVGDCFNNSPCNDIIACLRSCLTFFFLPCCPNWTQACSHMIDYIPGPIGSLFAIAPTHILEWQIFGSTAHLEEQFASDTWHCDTKVHSMVKLPLSQIFWESTFLRLKLGELAPPEKILKNNVVSDNSQPQCRINLSLKPCYSLQWCHCLLLV